MSMYDTFSDDYDRFVNWPGRLAAEMPFLVQQAQTAGGSAARVLDAACGTGMHAIALAQHGFITSGSDLSAAMIARARENAAKMGAAVDWRVGGFGELAQVFLDRAGRFDCLFCLGNSLPHVNSAGGLAAALRDFGACLRPGGRLVLQNRNFDAVTANRERWMEPQTHRDGEREWVFLRFYDYLPDGLINFNVVTLRRETPSAEWTQSVASTQLYPLRQSDLLPALQSAGFGAVETYGGLNGQPFDAGSSGNLVVVAVKR